MQRPELNDLRKIPLLATVFYAYRAFLRFKDSVTQISPEVNAILEDHDEQCSVLSMVEILFSYPENHSQSRGYDMALNGTSHAIEDMLEQQKIDRTNVPLLKAANSLLITAGASVLCADDPSDVDEHLEKLAEEENVYIEEFLLSRGYEAEYAAHLATCTVDNAMETVRLSTNDYCDLKLLTASNHDYQLLLHLHLSGKLNFPISPEALSGLLKE